MEDVPAVLKEFKKHRNLRMAGISTHFANIEDRVNHKYALYQGLNGEIDYQGTRYSRKDLACMIIQDLASLWYNSSPAQLARIQALGFTAGAIASCGSNYPDISAHTRADSSTTDAVDNTGEAAGAMPYVSDDNTIAPIPLEAAAVGNTQLDPASGSSLVSHLYVGVTSSATSSAQRLPDNGAKATPPAAAPP